ncbi:MAG: hypothetical protein IJB81_06160 [Clostridia bacterium]|nr:hypothetical protein [Clostridia bacterium]
MNNQTFNREFTTNCIMKHIEEACATLNEEYLLDLSDIVAQYALVGKQQTAEQPTTCNY